MTAPDLAALFALIRSKRVANGQWPASSDELLTLLGWSIEPFPDLIDGDLLERLIDGFLAGVDLREQYPDEFKLLLTNYPNRERFLSALDFSFEDGP